MTEIIFTPEEDKQFWPLVKTVIELRFGEASAKASALSSKEPRLNIMPKYIETPSGLIIDLLRAEFLRLRIREAEQNIDKEKEIGRLMSCGMKHKEARETVMGKGNINVP